MLIGAINLSFKKIMSGAALPILSYAFEVWAGKALLFYF
jgi:hypothetical protein